MKSQRAERVGHYQCELCLIILLGCYILKGKKWQSIHFLLVAWDYYQQLNQTLMHLLHCKIRNLIMCNANIDSMVSYMYSLNRVKYRGTVYTKEKIVVKTMTNDTPGLHKISEIVMTESRRLYFVLSSLPQVEYWSHYHAYTYEDSNTPTCVGKPEELLDFHAYTPHSTFSSDLEDINFIVLKYFLCD